MGEGARGEAKQYREKKKSRIGEARTGREERGTPKLFGVIAIRSRFSPFTTFSFSFAPFSFSSSPTTVLNTLSSKVRPPPCFSSSACIPTALYACKLPSRVRIKKEEKRRETEGETQQRRQKESG